MNTAVRLAIRAIRVPLAIVYCVLLVAIMAVAIIIEIPIAILWFIILSVFSSEDTIKQSWLNEFPNSARNLIIRVTNAFTWSWNTSDNAQFISYQEQCDSCSRVQTFTNGLVVVAAIILFFYYFSEFFLFLLMAFGAFGFVFINVAKVASLMTKEETTQKHPDQ
jgi:hypothetical protein